MKAEKVYRKKVSRTIQRLHVGSRRAQSVNKLSPAIVLAQLKEVNEPAKNFGVNNSLDNRAIQRAVLGNINCPNIGSAMAIGTHIHGILEADYLVNGHPNPAHPTWIKGVEIPTPTGQIPDLSLRTPGLGFIRSVGEIKPAGQVVAGAAQIATHLANMPAHGLNAVHPVINDPAWAAAATFPVANLDPAAVSPTGNVNVWQAPGTNGLYLYDG